MVLSVRTKLCRLFCSLHSCVPVHTLIALFLPALYPLPLPELQSKVPLVHRSRHQQASLLSQSLQLEALSLLLFVECMAKKTLRQLCLSLRPRLHTLRLLGTHAESPSKPLRQLATEAGAHGQSGSGLPAGSPNDRLQAAAADRLGLSRPEHQQQTGDAWLGGRQQGVKLVLPCALTLYHTTGACKLLVYQQKL